MVADDDDSEVTWVAGGGAEFLLTKNVSLGAEYLHYEFDDALNDNGGEAFGTSVVTIRGRVNVKLNSLFGG